MKSVFLLIISTLFWGHLFAQDETLDLISKVGTDRGAYSSHHFLDENTILVTFEKDIVVVNRSGQILSQGPNPLFGKKLKYNNAISESNYSIKEDVFYAADGYNKMLFISDYSTTNRKLVEIPISEPEGLRSSKDKYNELTKSEIDKELFFINENQVVIAEAYFSMSDESHGKALPEKEKYYSFLRLIYIDLISKSVTDEYVLKDVLTIQRTKQGYIDLRILKFEEDNIQVGVLESTSKLISPAAHGFSYDGNYTVYAYNVKTKNTITLAKQLFVTEPKAVNSILIINKDNLSITWNERAKDGCSLHNKTYHLSESFSFDSSFYHFPTEIVTLPTPSFQPVGEYENMKRERFCVLGINFIQNKWGKDPVPVYLIMKPNGEYEFVRRLDNEIILTDIANDTRYNLELEGESYQEFCEFFSKALDKQNERKVSQNTYVRHSGEVVRFENGKTGIYSTMISGSRSEMKLKVSDYIVDFYFYDFKL